MTVKALEEHHIKEVKTLRVSSRYTRTIERNSRIKYHGDGPNTRIRVIITDKGATGWGASNKPEEEVPDLVGRSIAELFDPAVGVIDDDAIFLDYALHDLAGVILDIPVHKMLGGKGELAIPCYDGAIYMARNESAPCRRSRCERARSSADLPERFPIPSDVH